MTIGIDARLYGLQHAGIGRYIENLIHSLLQLDQTNRYVIFGDARAETLQATSLQNPRVHFVSTNIRHYSLAEQTQFLNLLNQHPIDLMHFPHYNVPVRYQRPYVVTIHDLLWHTSKGGNVTTLSGSKYWLKYVGYRFVFRHAVNQAQAIIVPSHWVKEQLVRHYPKLKQQKIRIIHEGADHLEGDREKVPLELSSHLSSLNSPFFLYVGSCYPHKNVDTLIKALGVMKNQPSAISHQPSLIIVSSRNVFQQRLEKLVQELNLQDSIIFAGYITDDQLKQLYQQAVALVHPSLSEGFGFTGLEAMQNGCPVIASKAGSLPEIYGEAAIYFEDPTNPEAIAQVLKSVLKNPKSLKSRKGQGQVQAKKYTWQKSTQQTLGLYQSISPQ